MSKVKDDFDEARAAVEELYLKSDAQLVTEVEDVATKVYEALGGKREEDVYQQAMAVEFRRRNIPYRTKAPIEVLYEEERVGFARPDFTVDNRLVVELKAVESMNDSHIAQTKAYMRTLGLWNGFVVNFPAHGASKPQFKRLVNDAETPVVAEVSREVYEEHFAVPISRKMKKAVEEVSSAWAKFKDVEAEYEEMVCRARKSGIPEDDIEASESFNWRKVKPES